jgi:hypothetical protein
MILRLLCIWLVFYSLFNTHFFLTLQYVLISDVIRSITLLSRNSLHYLVLLAHYYCQHSIPPYLIRHSAEFRHNTTVVPPRGHLSLVS